MDDLDLREGVIKPLIGASGFGVERVTRGAEAQALSRARARQTMDRVLVQEFVGGIEDGESPASSLITYSHTGFGVSLPPVSSGSTRSTADGWKAHCWPPDR